MKQRIAHIILFSLVATTFAFAGKAQDQCALLVARYASLKDSPYEPDAAAMVRVLGWISEHPTESSDIFRRLRENLEHNMRVLTPKNRSLASRHRAEMLVDIEPNFSKAPSELFGFLSEWLERVDYPRFGVPPTRSEVIGRIRTFANQLNRSEKERLYRHAFGAKRIFFAGDLSDPRILSSAIRAGERQHYLEAFLQFLTFRFDQLGPAVLPVASYPFSDSPLEQSIRFTREILAGDPSRGSFTDEAALRARLKIAFSAANRRFFENETSEETRNLLERLIARSLEGKLISHPGHGELLSQFRNFLVAETWEMGRQLEAERETDSESDSGQVATPNQPEEGMAPNADDVGPYQPPEVDEVVAQLQQLDLSSEVTDYEERGFSPEVHPAFLPEVPGPSLASVEFDEALAPSTAVKVRKGKMAMNDFVEIGKQKLIERREVTRKEAVTLVAKMAATDWHARTVEKQLIELRKQHSETVFERELQSICRILREMEKNGRDSGLTRRKIDPHPSSVTNVRETSSFTGVRILSTSSGSPKKASNRSRVGAR